MAQAGDCDASVTEMQEDYLTKCFQPIEVISKGMCGEIVLAKPLNDLKRKQVVKKFCLLKKTKLARNEKLFYREFKFMQKLQHPFLIRSLMAVKCPDYYAISMDYCPGKTLKDYVGNLSIELTEMCIIQVACALRYMHKNNVAHLDVKLNNIFLDGEFNAILGDFGLSVELSPGQVTLPRRCLGGTPAYFAPEIKTSPLGKELNPYKLDSYCLGVVLWCLVFEQQPHKDTYYFHETRRKNDMQPHIRDMLLKLLQRDPEIRVSVSKFLDGVRQETIHRHIIKEN